MPFETFLANWINNNQQPRIVEPENYYNNEDPGMQIVGAAHQRRASAADRRRASRGPVGPRRSASDRCPADACSAASRRARCSCALPPLAAARRLAAPTATPSASASRASRSPSRSSSASSTPRGSGDRAHARARARSAASAVDAKDDLGRSALLLAARDAGSLELVRLLHAKGAAVDEPDLGGRAAISLRRRRRPARARALARRARAPQIDRARRGRAHAALPRRRSAITATSSRSCSTRGADVERRRSVRRHAADAWPARKGYGEMAALLLQRGADPAREGPGRPHRPRSRRAGNRRLPGPRPQ